MQGAGEGAGEHPGLREARTLRVREVEGAKELEHVEADVVVRERRVQRLEVDVIDVLEDEARRLALRSARGCFADRKKEEDWEKDFLRVSCSKSNHAGLAPTARLGAKCEADSDTAGARKSRSDSALALSMTATDAANGNDTGSVVAGR